MKRAKPESPSRGIMPTMSPKIITVPNPLLRRKSKPVNLPVGGDKKIRNLVNELIKTAKAAEEPRGVGLSAVQIGKPVRIFVAKKGEKFVPFINPKITWRSKKLLSQTLEKERLFLEGCLSVPGYYGFVNRPSAIKLKWQDLEGKVHQQKFKGKESTYIQHEHDHLNGILFVDRILEQEDKIYKSDRDREGKEILREINFE